METNEVKKYECYCCGKELKENEVRTQYATSSGYYKDGTKSEKRVVCKDCDLIQEQK